jgi:NagD protein
MIDIDSKVLRSPYSDEQLMARLKNIRHVALDMDGTIYMGGSLFPYTKPFLERLRRLGITYSFLTNNPSKSIADYLAKLDGMGIEATEEEMYTTALATIDYIRTHYPEAKRLFMLGTPSMQQEFIKAGFESTEDDPADVPDVVVVAFDMTLQYSRLCRAAWWAQQGVPYIATNPDRVCPTDQQVVLVDCGKCTYVFCGDECYTKDNLLKRKVTGSSVCLENSRYFIEEYTKERYVPVLFHDPDVLSEIGFKVLYED